MDSQTFALAVRIAPNFISTARKRVGTEAVTDKTSLSYKDAGVDIDAGNALVDRIKGVVKKTRQTHPTQVVCNGYCAARRGKKTGNQIQQGAFPRAARPENGYLLARFHRQGETHRQMLIKPGDINQS